MIVRPLHLLTGALGVLALAVSAVGCVAPVPYQPSDGLVDELGVEEAKEELGAVLTRSIAPAVHDVEVDAEKFSLTWHGRAGFYGPYAHGGRRTVYYKNVTRFELYENNKAWPYSGNNHLLDIQFGALEDAKLFADLVWSFKHHGSGSGRRSGGGSGGGGGSGDGGGGSSDDGGGPSDDGGSSAGGDEEHTRDLLQDE